MLLLLPRLLRLHGLNSQQQGRLGKQTEGRMKSATGRDGDVTTSDDGFACK